MMNKNKFTILVLLIFIILAIIICINIDDLIESKEKNYLDKIDDDVTVFYVIFEKDDEEFKKIVEKTSSMKNLSNSELLSFAIISGKHQFKKFMILLDLNIFDLTNGIYLNKAIEYKRNAMIKELIKRGATPTMEYFVYVGDYEKIKNDIQHSYYRTIRYKLYKLAVERNNFDVIELLLNKLFIKDCSNHNIFYLYQIAVVENNVKLLDLLYKMKFDPHVIHIEKNYSLLDFAYEFGCSDKVIEWLKKHGIKSKKYTKKHKRKTTMQDLLYDGK
ncbi:hypothetical protein AAEX28_16105 [Lentisphaerota bacterium WC36G]|nr:hypothetical protein LJT99_02860 [Lentisphaerae bacterium WC36]